MTIQKSTGRKSIVAACVLASTLLAQPAIARQIIVTCSGTSTSNNRNSYQTFNSRRAASIQTWRFDTVTRKFAGRMSSGSWSEGGSYEVSGSQLSFCRDLCGTESRPTADGSTMDLEFPRISVDLNSGATTFLTTITTRFPNGQYFRQQSIFDGRCDTAALAEVVRESQSAPSG